jgi:tetratricopeptide (TPR) repeat protein
MTTGGKWHSSGAFLPGVILVGLWGLAFSLACRLSVIQPSLAGGQESRTTVAGAFVGESRTALSGYFYEMADDYFHRGVPHLRRRELENTFFRRTVAVITPGQHGHLAGQDVREIMPWLWLAIRMNPRDVKLYLDAAFCLAHDMGRSDVAHEVLREALYANPGDYRILLDDGRIYLREGRLAEAGRALNAGLAFWSGRADPDGADAKFDKRSLLIYRGLVYETQGDLAKAADCYEQILQLFPEAKGFRDRWDALRRAVCPDQAPARVIRNTLEEEGAMRVKCEREGRHDEAAPQPAPRGNGS